MEEKTKGYIVIGLIVIAFIAGLLFDRIVFSGRTIQEDNLMNYSYTKAICNGEKCIDILIHCENGQAVNIKPVSDLVEFNEVPAMNNIDKLCAQQ
jgi:hypothetical protein